MLCHKYQVREVPGLVRALSVFVILYKKRLWVEQQEAGTPKKHRALFQQLQVTRQADRQAGCPLKGTFLSN